MPQQVFVLHQLLDYQTVFLERRLGSAGEIVVEVGDKVEPFTVLGKGKKSARMVKINLAQHFGISVEKAGSCLLVKVGARVSAGELLAVCKMVGGLVKKTIKAQFSGVVSSFDKETSELIVSSTPHPFQLLAGLGGRIKDIVPEKAVLIESRASLVSGVWAKGDDVAGEVVIVSGPDAPLSANLLRPNHAGKLVVGGSLVPSETIKKAHVLGVGGIISGGIHARDTKLVEVPLLVTEGFGQVPMSASIMAYLKSIEARHCYLSPENRYLAIPYLAGSDEKVVSELALESQTVLKSGMLVKVLSWPHFGLEGQVTKVIDEPQLLRSGLFSPIAVVELSGVGEVRVPVRNIGIVTS